MTRHIKGKFAYRFIVFSFALYMLLLVKFVLLKMPLRFMQHVRHWQVGNVKKGLHHLRLVPFKTTMVCLRAEQGIYASIENLGGNILGFVPMGILLPLVFVRLNTAKKTILAVLLISLSFELIQLFTGVGYCDIDDLWQNVLGGAIGYWLYKKLIAKHYSTNTNAAHK